MSADEAEVRELLTALRASIVTLDEVAEQFRLRAWARSRRPEPRTYREMAEQLDPGLPVPGSIDDVTAAYDRGELTAHQYDVLAAAIASAFRAEAERGDAQREPPRAGS
jgi:hypothetical protein